MRDIKFRAWEIKGKGFIAGFNMVNFHGYFNKGLKPNIYRYETEWEEGEYLLEQFTGLLDKNGKEIYEGDIVEFYRERHRQVRQMIWDDYLLCWEFKGRGYIGNLYEEEINSIKIIGNIHQNPELLEELA